MEQGAEIESARLMEGQTDGEAEAHVGHRRVAKIVAVTASVLLLGFSSYRGFVVARATPSFTPNDDYVKLASTNHEPVKADPFAVVPLTWKVITKQDGTGHVSKEKIQASIADLNKAFKGQQNPRPQPPDVQAILKGDNCYHKCNVALCYKAGTATDLNTKLAVTNKCHCDAQFCTHWRFLYDDEKPPKLDGPNLDTGISFEFKDVEYIKNDEWHLQCCCTHAALNYEIKQQEIFDSVVDKTTARSVTTIIVCDMSSKGGNTAGQSMIAGSQSCNGGPGIMMDFSGFGLGKDNLDMHYVSHTLIHEWGHHLGLWHTFNEECNGNFGCAKADVCTDKNAGDKISDTPVHHKQEKCPEGGADSCPDQPGKDPLDNWMSYSGCEQRRFTAKQVEKMKQTITDYFPKMLVSPNKPEAKDLPCDPLFPGGKVPSGYAPPKKENGHEPPSCQLEVGQCDQHDTTGCYCQDARHCCAQHGCGGNAGMRQCLPCEWKSWGTEFTADSCA